MAVESLTINGGSPQTATVHIQGNCVTTNGSAVTFVHPENAVYTKAIQVLVSQYKDRRLLKTIQNSPPFSDGSFFIHGDACTTVISQLNTQDIDEQDPIQIPQNGISIVDQCPACNDCNTKWQILQRIQTLQLIIAAYKDNQLVQNTQAKQRWSDMNKLRITQADGCRPAQSMDQRKAFVLPARRLFSQYKALVQMWNYLADYGNRSTKIRYAAGHPQGIALAIQYRTTECREANDALRISVKISLISGQVGEDAADKYIPAGGRLRLYASDIKAEHQLQSGATPSDTTGEVTQSDPTDTVTISLASLPEDADAICAADNIEINALFEDLSAISRSGISLNIIPVYKMQSQYPSGTGVTYICTSNQYYKLQRKATQLVLNKAVLNTWEINICWYLISGGKSSLLAQQTKYYSTRLCKVPHNTTYNADKTVDIQQDAAGFYMKDTTQTAGIRRLQPALGNNAIFYYDTSTDNRVYVKDSQA